MTDNNLPAGTVDASELTVGPLTASEWVSFALLDDGDDDRNPLPVCCANISEVRDAIFDVLRAGAGPSSWRRLASVWQYIEDDLGADPNNWSLPLRKLHQTFLAGRDWRSVPAHDGFAHLFARSTDEVREFLDMAPEGWDLGTFEGRQRALARLGGRFVGYVLDPDERWEMVRRLATTLGMDASEVAAVVDVLRLDKGLPFQPTDPALRQQT